MKHYLLTWYGITDLRAALGLEATDGPILSALKTRKYTDVVILAYTNPSKSPHGFTDEMRAEWEQWRTSDLEARLQLSRDKAQAFVDALSNTEPGHVLFMDWLKRELSADGVSCNVQLVPWQLRHLNDAQAIYDAAAFAVSLALSDTSEKTITTYVSPGTPVMAYTWALIARAHPHHNIAVIASSEPRLPPERIALPKDLLMPLVCGPRRDKPSEYDAIIHLLGHERMPIYFGMLQFKAALHIFITSQDYRHAGTVLSRCLPEACQCKTVIIQDPFKPADTRREIERQVSMLPPGSRIAVNMTGGTKLMFSGALVACWACGLEPFYFEIKHHNIIFIRDGQSVAFVGAKSLADFFFVNGFKVTTQGCWEDKPCRAARLNLTKNLWEARHTLGKLYQTEMFRKYKISSKETRNPPFSWSWETSMASFDADGNASLVLNGVATSVPQCDDFAQYLGGGWLEEYVFSLLRPLEEQGIVHDLRIGMEVDYAEKHRNASDSPTGEFDCTFTDGKRLWIVECKAGNVRQEHIQKLENNLKAYGGIAARGILVSSFPVVPTLLKRIRSSTAIHSLQAGEVSTGKFQKIITS